MDLIIYPNKLQGSVQAIPSKSHAHRLLICAAFSDKETFLKCPQTTEDIEATVRCLSALGTVIKRTELGYHVTPTRTIPASAELDCGESGSTLRFMLPIVCALGINTTFIMHGHLPYRPLSPLWEELERMGCSLSKPTPTTILTTGKIHAGNFLISGNVSSQFITGLLFAASLLDGNSSITITGPVESKPYIEMTQCALAQFGVITENMNIQGCFPFHSPGIVEVEGDWSNAAFFLVAKALGNNVEVTNLNPKSPQGDRLITEILADAEQSQISGKDIPDLIPILSVLYGATKPMLFTDIGRLRLKESDRVATVCNLLNQLGAKADATDNTLSVISGKYHNCTIDSVGDHRIAMAAAIAATVADGPITILGAECVAKSYPHFWETYKQLGGKYEQYIR